jgi:hypothetical protein
VGFVKEEICGKQMRRDNRGYKGKDYILSYWIRGNDYCRTHFSPCQVCKRERNKDDVASVQDGEEGFHHTGSPSSKVYISSRESARKAKEGLSSASLAKAKEERSSSGNQKISFTSV